MKEKIEEITDDNRKPYTAAVKTGQDVKKTGLTGKYDNVRRSWEDEVTRLFIRPYLKEAVDRKAQRLERLRILDIGCGFGNNLMPFLLKKYDCYGVEISDEICLLTQQLIEERGFSCNVKKGSNTNIPFGDNYFDLIISNNVLHYEKDEKHIHQALKEYTRVLKPYGSLFLMTTGPNHDIYTKAKVVGDHQYLIQDYDFRNGEQYFYFDNLKYLEHYMSKYFNVVEVGRVQEQLMTADQDYLMSVTQKKK